MIKLSSQELRNLWIDFFKKQNHLFVEPRSLIPDNDPSLLFINSGVATLKHYFSGQIEPPSKRLVNVQKVIRTNDIENVGLTSRHHTFFEMMGYFSIGDYFKKEAIQFCYDFLVKDLKVDPQLLYFTVFEADDEAYQIWLSLGIDPTHIIRCDRDRNFWDVGMGPCGPCTEIFYDRGEKYDPAKLGTKLFFEDLENDRFIEIWNIVFSEFNNDGQNNYTPLLQKNIDTGAGLERILSISQDAPTNFDTDLFQSIISAVQKYATVQYDVANYFSHNPQQTKINYIYRVIADHLRSIVLMVSDGVVFDNKGQGYIARKLLRRVAGFAKILELDDHFLDAGINAVIENLGSYYLNLNPNKNKIHQLINSEFSLFLKTLEQAWKILDQMIEQANGFMLDAKEVFRLVETYGFPKELLDEILLQKNYQYDADQYEIFLNEHKKISKKLKNENALGTQNNSLLNFVTPSEFDYLNTEISAEVIGLFNQNWEVVDQLNHEPGYVILDRTPIYALGGGQECDYGWIDQFYVSDVTKSPNNQNVHYLAAATLKLHQKVTAKHDPVRRLQLSRQHSAEHLLHASLKQILSPNIKQEGAAKAVNKISLDFRWHIKPQPEDLVKFENYVLNKIAEAHPVTTVLTTLEDAKAQGANAYFEDTYKKQTGLLRLVKISAESLELCGGTHISNSREIEDFLIFNLESKGAGSWRIEAVSGKEKVAEFLMNQNQKLHNEFSEGLATLTKLQTPATIIEQWTHKWNNQNTKSSWNANKELVKELKQFVSQKLVSFNQEQKKQLQSFLAQKLLNQTPTGLVVALELEDQDPKAINMALNSFFNELNHYLVVVFNYKNNTNQYYLAGSKTFWTSHNTSANQIVQLINQQMHGSGGGRLEVAQGSFTQPHTAAEVINLIERIVK
ncbi:alanyl-tRNA synthetase [Mycoplasmoides fastidiosum]|uniref:Alanine--tRNA ligase n=1 Tax=Mycoplasmoides fastidiosum TaxID=92758 RepID=A0ABU0LY83_9BACT|nr:alanine--tRNA ligase [Mycoplasmoides fastidiosum]MDQ0513659.1 alanyl-tRNA synthetase [Mycoplasmoides fastidiosum]UUD37921.1 alanine--tRNA ligase [Mycoplasmoides fastidiosum]